MQKKMESSPEIHEEAEEVAVAADNSRMLAEHDTRIGGSPEIHEEARVTAAVEGNSRLAERETRSGTLPKIHVPASELREDTEDED